MARHMRARSHRHVAMVICCLVVLALVVVVLSRGEWQGQTSSTYRAEVADRVAGRPEVAASEQDDEPAPGDEVPSGEVAVDEASLDDVDQPSSFEGPAGEGSLLDAQDDQDAEREVLPEEGPDETQTIVEAERDAGSGDAGDGSLPAEEDSGNGEPAQLPIDAADDATDLDLIVIDGEVTIVDDEVRELLAQTAEGDLELAEEEEAEPFVMPEGAEYEPEVALVSLSEDADVASVVEALDSVEGVSVASVTQEDIDLGFVKVELSEGVSVEDAVNGLRASGEDVIEGAQPNYVYHVDHAYTPAYLRWVTEPPLLSREELGTMDAMEEEAEGDQADGTQPDVGDAELPMGADGEAGTTGADGVDEDGETVAPDSDVTRTDGDTRALASDSERANDGEAAASAADAARADGETGEPNSDETQTDGEAASSALDEVRVEGEKGTPEELIGLVEQATSINDPKATEQWALSSLHAYEAWSLVRCEGHDVSIAILDNGFLAAHEDLAANVLATYDFYMNTVDVTPHPSGSHGSHVAGIASAEVNNGFGVAGVSYGAGLVLLAVFDPQGNAYSNTIVAAYKYIIDHPELNVRVVNMSLGAMVDSSLSESDDDELRKAVAEAKTKGIATVASAGNSGKSDYTDLPSYQYPGDYADIVSVINLEKGDAGVRRSPSSNYNRPGQGGSTTGSGKNISAPGTNIWSCTSSTASSYGPMNGTSMASPYVAGIMALIFAARPDYTVDQAVAVLYDTATDIGPTGWDREYGHGEANAYAAVKRAISTTPVVDPGKDLSYAEIDLTPSSFEYNGEEKKPTVVVKYDDTELSLETDYTVTYKNNVEVGTATAVISGMGAYTGERSVSFRILGQKITDIDVSFSPTTYTYGDTNATVREVSNGTKLLCHVPTVTVTHGGETLERGEDYTETCENFYSAGTGKITVTGKGRYSGTVVNTYQIKPCPLSQASIELSPSSYTYDGKTKMPNVTVKVRGVVQDSSNYILTYTNNVNAGTGKVTVKPGSGNLTGSEVTRTFTIKRAAISVPTARNYTYNGKAQTGVAKGTGYTLSGTSSATNVGTYTVYVTPDGNHCWSDGSTGAKKLTWKINRASVAKPTGRTLTYNGKVQVGVPGGTGYSLSGTASATNVGSYTARATVDSNHQWAGGSTGALTISWRIDRASVAKPTGRTLTYNGRAQVGVPGGTGYSLSGTATATNVGSYTARATLDANHQWSGGSTGALTISWRINRAGVAVPAGRALTYSGSAQAGVAPGTGYALSGTTSATDAGSYAATAAPDANHCWPDGSTGAKSIGWRIDPARLTSVSVASPQTYTGSALTPAPTVRAGSLAVPASGYAASYSGNVDVGTATVTVTGRGNYSGSASASFSITNEPGWKRISGASAYDTMRAVVQADGAFASGRGGTVVVATGDGYWDALAAAGLAGRLDAPILITAGGSLSPQARSEIERLRPSRAVVCGGSSSVSEACLAEVRALCPDTTRVSGASAADTAVAIWRAGSGWGGTAVVASSAGYWDALSIGPYSYAKAAPIFLTSGDGTLPASAVEALRSGGFSRVVIAGGTYSVPASVEAQARSAGVGEVVRLSGAGALDTSAAVARWELGEGLGLSHLSVASSSGYWDALSAAPLCGRQGSVLVLAATEGGYQAFDAVFDRDRVTCGHVLGGTFSISDDSWRYFSSR